MLKRPTKVNLVMVAPRKFRLADEVSMRFSGGPGSSLRAPFLTALLLTGVAAAVWPMIQ